MTFVSGLLAGSFLNVVSDRLESGKSVVYGRSVCDYCGKTLTKWELIPLLSYFIQKGRCSKCQHKLSWFYPVSEFITGVTFVGLAYWIKVFEMPSLLNWVLFGFYVVLFSFLIVIFLSDLKYMVIYDRVVIPAIITSALFLILWNLYYVFELYLNLKSSVFGKYMLEAGFLKNHALINVKDVGYTFLCALAIALFFLFLIYVTKGRGMGGGDVKLGFLIGLINGFPNALVAIFLGFLLGAIYSVGLVLIKRKGLKDMIPFGPFLILGCVITLFYGNQIISWYIKLL